MAQEPLSGYISMEISTEGKDGQQLSRSRFGWLWEKLVPKLLVFNLQFHFRQPICSSINEGQNLAN